MKSYLTFLVLINCFIVFTQPKDSNHYFLYLLEGDIYEKKKELLRVINPYSKEIKLNDQEYYLYWKRATSNYDLEHLDVTCQDLSILKERIMK